MAYGLALWNGQLGGYQIIGAISFLTAPECTEFVFCQGSTPDPAGGAYDASSDPLVGRELVPNPHPSPLYWGESNCK